MLLDPRGNHLLSNIISIYNKITQGMKRLSFHQPTNPEKNHNPEFCPFPALLIPYACKSPPTLACFKPDFEEKLAKDAVHATHP
jgi:hypothetical protein